MTIKKIVTVSLMLLFMLSGISFAAEEVFKSDGAMYDLRPIPSKSSFKEASDNINQTSSYNISSTTITNTSSVDCRNNIIGSTPYAIALSDSTTQEDYIMAKARTYNSSGSLLDQKIDEQWYASHAGISAFNDTILRDDYAYGNHKYVLSGYLDVNHETYDTW